VLALFPQMSKSEFQLAYDGPSLRDGTMEVGELASSLLAVGDLLRNANRELNGNRAEVSLHVKADFKSGSFDVALLLDQGLLEQANNILIPGAVVGGTALLHLVFGQESSRACWTSGKSLEERSRRVSSKIGVKVSLSSYAVMGMK